MDLSQHINIYNRDTTFLVLQVAKSQKTHAQGLGSSKFIFDDIPLKKYTSSTMNALALIGIVSLMPSLLGHPVAKQHDYDLFTFVTREEWGGRPPTTVTALRLPVPFVIIHHTYIPGACFNFEDCSASMRAMQNVHQLENGWVDIGYNFAVSSDGTVYEGRGWSTVGAHATGFNVQSIGIALIGDWVAEVPPAAQLETTKNLIEEGIKWGYISESYDLIGHRQVRATECPGDALFNEISSWDRFRPVV